MGDIADPQSVVDAASAGQVTYIHNIFDIHKYYTARRSLRAGRNVGVAGLLLMILVACY
jgi:hypothetical protein